MCAKGRYGFVQVSTICFTGCTGEAVYHYVHGRTRLYPANYGDSPQMQQHHDTVVGGGGRSAPAFAVAEFRDSVAAADSGAASSFSVAAALPAISYQEAGSGRFNLHP